LGWLLLVCSFCFLFWSVTDEAGLFRLELKNAEGTMLTLWVINTIVSLFLFDPHHEFNMHIDAPVEKEEDLYSA